MCLRYVNSNFSFNSDVDTPMGISFFSEVTIEVDVLTKDLPSFMVLFRAQSPSHILERKTSQQYLPMASLRGMPVIISAARLKDVIRHL